MIRKNVTPDIDRYAMNNFDLNPFDNIWESMYQLLIDFKDIEGHCNVSIDHKTSCGINLGVWCQDNLKILRVEN